MEDPPRLLLVDDDPEVLQALGAYLTWAFPSADVVTAQGGREALAILERDPVDLVITDYRMPYVDGLELVARIHKRWPTSGTVMLTAYPEERLAIDAINRGHIRQFLTKPVTPEALASVVRLFLGEHHAARVRGKGAPAPGPGAGGDA